jgi:exopolysaccharide biosynthesis polyprenyl glycosylphosphotransferase
MGISGLIAYFLRDNVFHLSPIAPSRLFAVVVYSGSILILFALVLGVYRASFHTSIRHQYALAGKAFLLAVPVILASFYFLRWSQLPRVFTTLFLVSIPFLYPLGRILLHRFAVRMQKRGFGLDRTLLIDEGTGGPFIFRKYDLLPELGYEVVAVAFWNGTPIESHHYDLIEVARCQSGDELRKFVQKQSVERVVVTTLEMPVKTIADIFEVCRETGASLKLLSQESEELLRFPYVKDLAGITLYSTQRQRIEKAKRITKRAFDIVGSTLAILLFSPILILTALATMIESGRPVIFKQKRCLTKGGKEFDFYKFRSMVFHADEMKEGLAKRNETDGALFKIRNDPRMTRLGRIIRKLSIDELPQLFNVLKGDMSLVGPRPLPVGDFERLNVTEEFWAAIRHRESAKPGITGLWQISGRSHTGFREMVLLDCYYIENQSVLFDLEILFATIPVVLFGKGAY